MNQDQIEKARAAIAAIRCADDARKRKIRTGLNKTFDVVAASGQLEEFETGIADFFDGFLPPQKPDREEQES